MNSVFARRVRFYLVLLGALGGVGCSILPPSVWRGGARHNARRASCQSNLKQIGLALQQYAQNYEGQLPPKHWKEPLLAYTKTGLLFQCAETKVTKGANDYFFNARFLSKSLEKIDYPQTLILMGDGQDDATLFSIPAVWRTDKNSPAWRHLDMANYLFADGHVNAMKVNRDFWVVNP